MGIDLNDDGGLGLAALRPGAGYRVKFDDCCVAGEFTDVFVGLEFDDQETDFVTAAVFSHARITKFDRVEIAEAYLTASKSTS